MYRFKPCTLGGGKVKRQRLNMNYTYKGGDYLVRNVPIGMCRQCSKTYIVSHMSRLVERFLEISHTSDSSTSKNIITIPNDIVGF